MGGSPADVALGSVPGHSMATQGLSQSQAAPYGAKPHLSPPWFLSPALLRGPSEHVPAVMSEEPLLLSLFLMFHSIASIFIHSLLCAELCARHQGAQKKWIFHQPIKRRKVPAFAFFFSFFSSLIFSEQPQKKLPEPRLSPFCYSARKAGLSFPQAGEGWGVGRGTCGLQLKLKQGRCRNPSKRGLGSRGDRATVRGHCSKVSSPITSGTPNPLFPAYTGRISTGHRHTA